MTTQATFDLAEWVQNDLFGHDFDWEHWLNDQGLEPKRHGNYFTCKCPSCEKTECAFWPNVHNGKPRFECNRKNNCGYGAHVLAYLDKGSAATRDDFPKGQELLTCVKQFATFAGKELSKGNESFRPSPPKRRLLNEFWEFLKSRFPESEAEKYVRNRGLEPSKHEFGLFPEKVEEVLFWGNQSGWKVDDLEEAGLIKPNSRGGYYCFASGRLAAAFKDSRGNVFNIWARDLTGKAEESLKYLNLRNSVHAHKKAPYETGPRSDTIVWVEGYLDACALAECGYRAASAGSSNISTDMWTAAPCKHAVVLLDDDTAGKAGMLKHLERYFNDESPQMWFVNRVLMLRCKDFAELYQKHKREAVCAALESSTWVHRDTMLAELLIELGSEDKGSLSPFETEEIFLRASELDKRLSPQRCPSFAKFFWEPLCETTGHDLAVVQATVENARERQRREQARARLKSLSGAFHEAISKGKAEDARSLQDSINREMQALEQQGDAIRDLTTPYTRDDLESELEHIAEGVRTGLVVGGEEIRLAKGGVTVIAGPTNHGKTTFLCNVALNAIFTDNSDVLFITLEESRGAITARLAHSFIGMELSRHSLGTLKHWYGKRSKETFFSEFKNNTALFKEFIEKEAQFWPLIKNKRLTVVTPEKSLNAITATITAAIERNPQISCVVLDYLQLVEPPEKTGAARHEELKPICDSLHTLSKDYGIAIVTGAQFNRTVVSEDDLDVTRIGEGGSIERFADQVIGFWNRTFKQETKRSINNHQGLYVDILKNRNFPRRSGELSWNGNLGKIENIEASNRGVFG